MNYDTCDHVLWPYDSTEDYDPFEEADVMFTEHKLNKRRNDNKSS